MKTRTVRIAIYSPNGKLIITGSDSRSGGYNLHDIGTVDIWDSQSGEHVRQLQGCYSTVARLVCSPDSEFIIVISDSGLARVWDVATGKPCDISERFVLFDPKNSRRRRAIWDLERGEEVRIDNDISNENFGAVLGYKLIITMRKDGIVYMWKSKVNKHTKTQDEAYECVTSSSFYITISNDGIISAWEEETDNFINKLDWVYWNIRNIHSIREPARTLVVSDNGAVIVYEGYTGQLVRRLVMKNKKIKDAQLIPDCQIMITESEDEVLEAWDLEKGKYINTIEEWTPTVDEVLISPDGKFLIFVHRERDISKSIIKICNSETDEEKTIEANRFLGVTFSSNSNYVYTASNSVDVWDAKTGECVRALDEKLTEIVSFSSDGKLIVDLDSNQSMIRVCDSETGKEVKKFKSYPFLHIEGCSFKKARFTDSTIEMIVRQYGGVLS